MRLSLEAPHAFACCDTLSVPDAAESRAWLVAHHAHTQQDSDVHTVWSPMMLRHRMLRAYRPPLLRDLIVPTPCCSLVGRARVLWNCGKRALNGRTHGHRWLE